MDLVTQGIEKNDTQLTDDGFTVLRTWIGTVQL